MKSIYKASVLVVLAAGTLTMPISCKKSFLNEEQITARNYSDYQTSIGLDALIVGMYQSLKFHFNYEWAHATTQNGVDEFTVGGDRTKQMWNSYDANLNSLTAEVANVWDNMYSAINAANIAIENIPQYYDANATRNTRLGEAYFIRAFNYFKLVKQYGGVPIKLNQSVSVQLEFPRATAKETYQLIIDDFTQAYRLLPATTTEVGRIARGAAGHFLAKAYLFRASELYNDWNADTRTSDLNMAVSYADSVINSGNYTLATNFRDLWNFTTPDGPNETNREIILAAQFSSNVATQGRYGNQVHLYYPSVYQNLAGMQRDIPGGREFQRLRSTDYAADVYDRVNDSRFWKSFKTRYNCNRPATAPTWTATYAPTPAQVGQPKFAGNDTAILYIVNNAGDTRYTSTNLGYRRPHMYVRYFSGQAQSMLGNHGNYGVSQYVALSKFMDGSRNSVANAAGQRDGILARLAETYLIAAEAYGRLGQYSNALPYLNAVRDRAAYKAGEDRSAYVDGGVAYRTNSAASAAQFVSYSDRNTYYESNNIAVDTSSTLAQMHLNSVGDIFGSTREFYSLLSATSQQDQFIAFILNERSRELMGELMRWEDLARTRTLVRRATVFNSEARPLENKDYLRPIPQTHLDAIQQGGSPLTPDQKANYQNPGW